MKIAQISKNPLRPRLFKKMVAIGCPYSLLTMLDRSLPMLKVMEMSIPAPNSPLPRMAAAIPYTNRTLRSQSESTRPCSFDALAPEGNSAPTIGTAVAAFEASSDMCMQLS